MADNYGVGALGGVVLVDPDTGLPYKATGGGGGGGGAVDSVNGKTGTVVLDAGDIGLGNVTNDAQLKASDLDTDPDLTADSDSKVPSQKAVKAYVDANAGGGEVEYRDYVFVYDPVEEEWEAVPQNIVDNVPATRIVFVSTSSADAPTHPQAATIGLGTRWFKQP